MHDSRRRRSARQHIQMLVNELARDGYVERGANPDHKRSRLVHLTVLGRGVVTGMRRREVKLLPNLDLEGWRKQVQRARRTERSRDRGATRGPLRTYRMVDE